MMLTKEDLQAISELINGAVSASENRIMAYIESDVKKEIRQIADGHKQLAEKMDRMEQKIESFVKAGRHRHHRLKRALLARIGGV